MKTGPKAICAYYNDTHFTVGLDDGRFVCVKFEYSSRLSTATPAQRKSLKVIYGGMGIRWADIDEDLSVAGIVRDFEERGILTDAPNYDLLE